MAKKVKKKKHKIFSNFDLLNFVIVIVCAIYVISLLATMINPMYKTPVELHALMGTIVGTLLTIKVKELL